MPRPELALGRPSGTNLYKRVDTSSTLSFLRPGGLAAALVALMNECLSSTESGADDLVAALVQMLESEAPQFTEGVSAPAMTAQQIQSAYMQ